MKNLFLFFICSFAFVFLVLNILQFFNYMGRQVTALMEISPQISLSPTLPVVVDPLKQKEFPLIEKENSLEITKLGLEAPLVFAVSTEIKAITQDLKNGVVVYPESSLPGQSGELIVLGHSSPPGWPKIRYDWVFSKLGELEAGDNIVINFAGLRHDYMVINKVFLEKGQALPENNSDNSKQFLYLVTCWPPGKDFKRLVVEAELSLTR
ncbi:MAG: hypothetical protein COX42_00810 [Parcubacteria group bacterium CG23_combo_of_CG06-09_8_20_14_all_35_6]|nr:MAG: hypothetical protein COX42_00810 [Parcubacteria group bacterium CG23_combo_of_CG06-09_8_20_14_all_35_6]